MVAAKFHETKMMEIMSTRFESVYRTISVEMTKIGKARAEKIIKRRIL